ncbi:ABC transporter substrate-binding protein [Maribacter sp. ANRC-HE7]|uniref:ABC transporter substrate-binding protein n=1 Tax=Maribacter aquimaris TaxID=2737171 RepID=A0ABR7UZD4_9FLAO|nr:ABC transporter substrate-binding protein [Maribacter aquimaris]MBD0777908.1 ABC transporter substrate-binding protein [Maribacter aquimaris]
MGVNKTILNTILFYVFFAQMVCAQHTEVEDVITIGLLVNDDTSQAARNAAELAIHIANKDQGLNGKQFKVVTRSMEGPWGTGSKEAVNLVFKEKVWALLGSHDGRNAHLAEQVIAKTRVVFLSAWASDPTLSQAYIPWFYNCVPNDIQQAEVLVNEIVNVQKTNTIAIAVQEDYDAKTALKYLEKQLVDKGGPKPLIQTFAQCLDHTGGFMGELRNKAVEALIILGDPEQSWELMGVLRKNGVKLPFYGTIPMLGVRDLSIPERGNPSDLTILYSGNWLKTNTLQSQHGAVGRDAISNAMAAYTFDAMNVLINAIKASGFDRDKVYETMSKTDFEGVTGNVQFDKNGNRRSDLKLVGIANEDTTSQKQ